MECDLLIAQECLRQFFNETDYRINCICFESNAFQNFSDAVCRIQYFVNSYAVFICFRNDFHQHVIDSLWEVDICHTCYCIQRCFQEFSVGTDTRDHCDVLAVFRCSCYCIIQVVCLMFFAAVDQVSVCDCQCCISRCDDHTAYVSTVYIVFLIDVCSDNAVSTDILRWSCAVVNCYAVHIHTDVADFQMILALLLCSCYFVSHFVHQVNINIHCVLFAVEYEFSISAAASELNVCQFRSYYECSRDWSCVVDFFTVVQDVSDLSVSSDVSCFLELSAVSLNQVTLFVNTDDDVSQQTLSCCELLFSQVARFVINISAHWIYAAVDQSSSDDHVVIFDLPVQFSFVCFRCQDQISVICSRFVVQFACYSADHVNTHAQIQVFLFIECYLNAAQAVACRHLSQEVSDDISNFFRNAHCFQLSIDGIHCFNQSVDGDSAVVSVRYERLHYFVDSFREVDIDCSGYSIQWFLSQEFAVCSDTCNHGDVIAVFRSCCYTVLFTVSQCIVLVESHCALCNIDSCCCRCDCHISYAETVSAISFVNVRCDYGVSTNVSWRFCAVVDHNVVSIIAQVSVLDEFSIIFPLRNSSAFNVVTFY